MSLKCVLVNIETKIIKHDVRTIKKVFDPYFS